MSAAPSPAPRRALKQTTAGGFIAWARRTFGRATPRAQVIAAPELRLGEQLDVSWRIDYGSLDVTNVSVTLVGTEAARQRISARTGISTVTESRPFIELPIDRQMPEQTARAAEGRGAVIVPLVGHPERGRNAERDLLGHRRRGRLPVQTALARRVSRRRSSEVAMSAPPIALELTLEDGCTVFEPGARLTASRPGPRRPPRAGWSSASAGRCTAAAGRDFKIADTIPFPAPAATERRPFILTLPEGPYSFRGRLVTLTWTLATGGASRRGEGPPRPDRRPRRQDH